MYPRWPRLNADINLPLACKQFPSHRGPYKFGTLKGELRPGVTFTPLSAESRRSHSTTFGYIPEDGPDYSQSGFTTKRSACRYGSWRSNSIKSITQENTTFSSRYHHERFFATSTARKKMRGKAFVQGPSIEMAATGAAREKFYFQFITTPTSDTPGTSLLLHFDSKRYLLGNVSEGTQRACIQRGITLRKVKNIFLTGAMNWKNTGGLIGTILTLADVQAAEREAEKLRPDKGAPPTDSRRKVEASSEQSRSLGEETLVIHGGETLMHTMACARRFVFRKGMPVSVNEYEHANDSASEKPTWKDENIQVWAMSIAQSTSKDAVDEDME